MHVVCSCNSSFCSVSVARMTFPEPRAHNHTNTDTQEEILHSKSDFLVWTTGMGFEAERQQNGRGLSTMSMQTTKNLQH